MQIKMLHNKLPDNYNFVGKVCIALLELIPKFNIAVKKC